VLTDVIRFCPNVKRNVPSSSMRIAVTSEYYRRTSTGYKISLRLRSKILVPFKCISSSSRGWQLSSAPLMLVRRWSACGR
jgi:hypothetical protein